MNLPKNAANLSLTNESEFIKKYIINECEILVNGLEKFYAETKFKFIDEHHLNKKDNRIIIKRVDIKGYDLIDFRTEKIIGALDFIRKIIEYNTIFPTDEYTQRIISINKKFIPNVIQALENQNIELANSKDNFHEFTIRHNELLEKHKFYLNEKLRLKTNFETQYNEEYSKFIELLTKSSQDEKQIIQKIKLHTDNVNKLTGYIKKYNKLLGDN
ncbi:hypothetical protein [uncultured Flavobacterium sp.]|uniref:hypothetical protein n=1 Tax=uncultured Flavobacterium sp. TaxID=165435 RepID=UPI002596055B|nr:hypothetical protein [uncultured Flavobacterium sp.]